MHPKKNKGVGQNKNFGKHHRCLFRARSLSHLTTNKAEKAGCLVW